MERAMGGEITVWWGPDDMVSALGFGTEENMEPARTSRPARMMATRSQSFSATSST